MRRIVKDIEFKQLSKPVRVSLGRMLLAFAQKIDKEIVHFTKIAVEHLDKQEVESEWQTDKFAETIEMLEQLANDFKKEVERIK